ncbi:MAG: FAD-dependent oxidoreductase [Pseudomonadales bacterium]|nr:FAD-dependent oxidoreductase [Pseudomonadales bacterium]
MRVAVVGTGISGLTAAWLLRDAHDVTVYEAEARVGGHTHTHEIEIDGQPVAVDTGFIVYNDRNYPTFTRLLAELGVTGTPTSMSFSVVNRNSDVRYNGSGLSALFAHGPNRSNPRFYRMLRDILRFNRLGLRLLDLHGPGPTLAQHVRDARYGAAFVRDYLAPMAASIWSVPTRTMGSFPAKRVVEFFRNHGLTSLSDRPQWYCVDGGSSSYVERILAALKTPPRIGTPVRRVRRGETVEIATDAGTETFDAVVLACHSDQALALLADPTPAEREVLGAIRYQPNDVVLHTDERFLPELPALRASWNYLVEEGQEADGATVTYWMNRLQHLEVHTPLLVTLNQTAAIDEAKVLRRLSYSHPIFDAPAVAAQARRDEISGVNGTWYCGAYWRYGFHEDGCLSAVEAVRAMGVEW